MQLSKQSTLWEAIVALYEQSGITLASAVAFSFIISLFPFCILIGSLAGLVGGRDLADQAVALMVETLPLRVAETLEPEVLRIMGTTRFDLVTVSAAFALFFATQWVPEYLEFDDARALAKKALWAFGSIPGERALCLLKLLAKWEDLLIREIAETVLERRTDESS